MRGNDTGAKRLLEAGGLYRHGKAPPDVRVSRERPGPEAAFASGLINSETKTASGLPLFGTAPVARAPRSFKGCGRFTNLWMQRRIRTAPPRPPFAAAPSVNPGW